jgi:pyruvate dehydrogenase (quinone)
MSDLSDSLNASMTTVTPPFVAPEALVGMAVYTARAMLHGKGHDLWEMIEENTS